MSSFDFEYLAEHFNTSFLQGCDSSFANIFLYQKKFNTILEIKDDILIRYVMHDESAYFAFPISLKSSEPDYLIKALDYIFHNFKNPHFHLITEEQKNLITNIMTEHFPGYSIDWETDRVDTDYIYLQKNMVELSGSVLQKKKNHINRFLRAYENRWTFKTFPENPIKDHILKVEEKWFEERNGYLNDDLKAELEIITNALNNSDLLKITGGVLYIDDEPVAMTLASPISTEILDIQFEKATGESVCNGAYAVINNLFAKTCGNYTYLNREEDLGIEGLRKAKLSYKPEILLHKFYGQVKCNN